MCMFAVAMSVANMRLRPRRGRKLSKIRPKICRLHSASLKVGLSGEEISTLSIAHQSVVVRLQLVVALRE